MVDVRLCGFGGPGAGVSGSGALALAATAASRATGFGTKLVEWRAGYLKRWAGDRIAGPSRSPRDAHQPGVVGATAITSNCRAHGSGDNLSLAIVKFETLET